MVFDNGYLVSKVAKAERVTVEALSPNSAKVSATMSSGLRVVVLSDYIDKSFVVEEAAEKYDYKTSPVEGLRIWEGLCQGKFQVRPMTDEERP